VLRAKGWGMAGGDALVEMLVTPPEQRPWRPEELLMLQTVFQYTPPTTPTDVEVVTLSSSDP